MLSNPSCARAARNKVLRALCALPGPYSFPLSCQILALHAPHAMVSCVLYAISQVRNPNQPYNLLPLAAPTWGNTYTACPAPPLFWLHAREVSGMCVVSGHTLCARRAGIGRSGGPVKRGVRLQALVELAYNGVQALLYSTIVYFMVGFDHNLGQHPLLSPCTSMHTKLLEPLPAHGPCQSELVSQPKSTFSAA